MKKMLIIAMMLIYSGIIAQNPCQDGTIIINGKDVDAVSFDNNDMTGLKLPLWLEEGTSLAAGNRVQIISVIEFNVISQASTTLEFSKVIGIGTVTRTVPAGKVWKVEAIVKHANSFATGFTASSNSPVCAGSQLNLTATSVAGATYSWTGPNGFTSSQQNPVISNVSLAAAGTYSMYATLNGCTSTASTTDVTVNALPPSTFTHNPTLPIANANITFTPALSGATYSWLFDQGTPSTSTAENPVVQWSTAGNYDVTLTVTDNNGCTSSTLMVVTVSNCTPGQPSSAFTWSPTSPQPGQSVAFSPATSGASYDWTFSGGSIGSSNVENPNVTWSNAGTYSASLTVTSGGCFTTTTENVVVQAPVTLTFNNTNTGNTGSIQSWIVPAGVTTIEIEAYGAQGGTDQNGNNGGLGAMVKGTFNVNGGATLKILVGQMGQNGEDISYKRSGGGGGGSFVWIDGVNTLLIAAGGGGGQGLGSTLGSKDGNINTNGNNGFFSGGTGGNGGTGGVDYNNNDSGGGGGWFSSGTGTGPGQSIINGNAYGGTSNHNGGYGGGGGSTNSAGGGGGYSGGGGGNNGDYSGGGGGSYNGGTNQTNTAGIQTGNGQVKITY